jgi:TolB protein
MKINRSLITILLTALTLTACAPDQSAQTPTPVSLGTQAAATSTRVAQLPPTATRIPPPSPTATPTALIFPSLATATPTPNAVTPVAEVITGSLNVRQGPGLAYPIIDAVAAGAQFTVIGADIAGDWLQVVQANGNPGWITAHPELVRLRGVTLANLPLVEAPAPPPVAQPAAVSSTGPGLTGQLIFSTGSGGELYVVNANGANLRRLTGGVIDPVLSPNGRQVAFTRWDGAEFGALFTISLDGSGERAVVGDIRQPKSPAWSPDGSEIIISHQRGGLRDPQVECRHFDQDDGIRLPDDIAEITSFRTTADGITVCFIRREDLKWGLRQINVASGQFEDLPTDAYSYTPAWNPQQGWQVIYDSDKGLMQFDVTGQTQRPLTTDLRDTAPVFSPDGRTLALTYKQHLHWEVYTLNLQNGQRQRLTKPPILADPQYSSAAPAWSPDGQHLAFFTNRAGRWEIWVMNADGSNQRPLLPPEVQAQLDLQYRGFHERMLGWTQ